MHKRRGTAILIAVAIVTLAACSSGGTGKGGGGGQVDLSAAEQRYGPAASKAPNFTYQSDVVMIENGPQAIRRVSSDGLTWTMDKNARGVADLRPGKVMYASSRALGRVMHIEPAGDDVAVMLAPIQLTDLIKDGKISIDEPLDLDAARIQPIPDAPGAVTELPKEAETSTTPGPAEPTEPDEGTDPDETTEPEEPSGHQESQEPEDSATPSGGGSVASGGSGPLTRAQQEHAIIAPAVVVNQKKVSGDLPAPWFPGDFSTKLSAGNFDLQPYLKKGSKESELGVRIMAGRNSDKAEGTWGLKGGMTIRLHYVDMRAKTDISISGGQVQDSTVAFNGLKKIALDLDMGSAEGTKDNTRLRVEVPYEFNLPPIAAAPWIIPTIKIKFVIKLGFTSRNSTASGTVSYTIAGDIGTSGAARATIDGSPVESFSGTSMAPFGIIVAFEAKITLGVGMPGLTAGPYGKAVVTVGYANSGVMGPQLCRTVTTSLSAGVGIGVNISTDAKSFLTKLFAGKGSSFKLDEENKAKEWPIFSTTSAVPNTAYCRAE
jgi:hypothetical protein